LIQNADDAGATEIAFILDTRQLKTDKTFGDCFNKLQGPAILCWNNATFSDCDLKGITSLGMGSKRKDVAKIGRFGVGFNSVYHFTDAPQFISDFSDYVIFDPLCEHLEGLESTNPGMRIRNVKSFFKPKDNNEKNDVQSDEFTNSDDDKNGDDDLSDVGSGFEIPGFNLKGCSMFRLALRGKPSEICRVTHPINSTKQLMKEFLNQDGDFLLFLKKVK